MFMQLPETGQLHTATDVIDFLTMAVGDMIITENDNIYMTKDQFDTLFARTFPVALENFLARLDKADPELGRRLRRQFVAEFEASEV